MSAPEVDSVVSPATFVQVFSPQAGDFVILLRDQSTNPKFRLIDVSNVGGTLDFLDDGVLISSRNAVNLVGGGFILTDDAINERANLQLGVQVQEDAVDQTLRPKINFVAPNIGQGFILTDDAFNDRIDVQLFGSPFIAYNRTGTSDFPVASGSNALVAGAFAEASGVASLAWGTNCLASADRSVAIGLNSDITSGCTESIAIGTDNLVDNNSEFALVAGVDSSCINTSTDSMSLGRAAICSGALRSVQLGTGTNNDDDTFQFQSVTLGNNVSIEVASNAGSPNGSVSARIRTILVDSNTGTDLYINTDGATAWSLISGGGGAAYTASSVSSGVDVTLTPGVSDNRVFISPTVASINCILLTAGASNTTFFTIVNDDPGTGTIDVKIDLAGNPTQVTLDNSAPVINAVFDGVDYKFYS